MASLDRVTELISRHKIVNLFIHQQPDGDAIGSAVALKEALSAKGKTVEIICPQPIPQVFESLTGPLKIRQQFPDSGLIVLLDCAEQHRTGFSKQIVLAKKNSRPIVVIDHHKQGDIVKIGGVNLVNHRAAATTEVVYQLIQELRVPVTAKIASALLLGIYTDTGGFRHSNTTDKTLELVSRLLRYGADLPRIVGNFMPLVNGNKKKLWGVALSEARINKWGVVSTVINKKTLKDAAATDRDVAGLANYLALTAEAKSALVLVEVNGGWRATMRTRHSDIDLRQLLKIFGGKGNKKAVGFTATNNIFSGKI